MLLRNDVVEKVVAQFDLKHEKHPVRSTSVWVVIFLVLSTLVILVGYFRYVWVKKVKKIDLNERHPRKILVITDLENRHHIDIVLKLNQYFKVSEVFNLLVEEFRNVYLYVFVYS